MKNGINVLWGGLILAQTVKLGECSDMIGTKRKAHSHNFFPIFSLMYVQAAVPLH